MNLTLTFIINEIIMGDTFTERDREWVNALLKEFDIRGGAIQTHDDKWVKEKDTFPERWARILKLVLSPPDTKLHNYQPDPPIDISKLK